MLYPVLGDISEGRCLDSAGYFLGLAVVVTFGAFGVAWDELDEDKVLVCLLEAEVEAKQTEGPAVEGRGDGPPV